LKYIKCPLCKEVIKKNNLKGHCWWSHKINISKDPNKKVAPWDKEAIEIIKKIDGEFP